MHNLYGLFKHFTSVVIYYLPEAVPVVKRQDKPTTKYLNLLLQGKFTKNLHTQATQKRNLKKELSGETKPNGGTKLNQIENVLKRDEGRRKTPRRSSKRHLGQKRANASKSHRGKPTGSFVRDPEDKNDFTPGNARKTRHRTGPKGETGLVMPCWMVWLKTAEFYEFLEEKNQQKNETRKVASRPSP